MPDGLFRGETAAFLRWSVMLEAILRGLLGIAVLLGLCVLLSSGRRAINWSLVGGGILLQAVLAFLILMTPFGGAIDLVSSLFVKLLGFNERRIS